MSNSRKSTTKPLSAEGIDALAKFFYWGDYNTFQNCFGIQMGEHLWEKFAGECHRDAILFWGCLDINNRKLLVDAVNHGIACSQYLQAKDARIREAARV